MTEKDNFTTITEALKGRRYMISSLDAGSGTFAMSRDGRGVKVTLEPALLADYYEQLSQSSLPGLDASHPDGHNGVLNEYMVIWIEEFFDSDMFNSLLEIRLRRDSAGRISISDRRNSLAVDTPTSGPRSGQFWSPDRPST